jgi:hypothetical protein
MVDRPKTQPPLDRRMIAQCATKLLSLSRQRDEHPKNGSLWAGPLPAGGRTAVPNRSDGAFRRYLLAAKLTVKVHRFSANSLRE